MTTFKNEKTRKQHRQQGNEEMQKMHTQIRSKDKTHKKHHMKKKKNKRKPHVARCGYSWTSFQYFSVSCCDDDDDDDQIGSWI